MEQHQCCNHEIVVFGFAEKVHRLTRDDVKKLYRFAKKYHKLHHHHYKREIENALFEHFGFSTNFSGIVKTIKEFSRENFGLIAKTTIFSEDKLT